MKIYYVIITYNIVKNVKRVAKSFFLFRLAMEV